MKILGIIPARGGSKGVVNKNIRLCGGKPLIQYSIDAAFNSRLIDFIVTTDSVEISEVALNLGAKVPFLRSSSLAQDDSKSIDVVIDALERYEEITGSVFDAVMMLQPTCPMRTGDHINEAISLLTDNIDSVISVVEVEGYHPARMKVVTQDGFLKDTLFSEKVENQPRQELDRFYIRNGLIYLTRREVLSKRSFKGEKSFAYIMSPDVSVNIDSMMDFRFANFLLNEDTQPRF